MTHKLNRHEATPADILNTLHDSMAGKVVALLEKGQRPLRRVLLIGGVTRNAACWRRCARSFRRRSSSCCRRVRGSKRGAAHCSRATIRSTNPRTSPAQPVFETLPPLHRYEDQVQVMAAPPLQAPPDGPLVLGVDAGSTTTKAILLDPATRSIVASHYARTHDDPVAAVRECLRALIGQVGNRPVGLVGTTGSARELVGACLGTEHVYNEISAHAAGATHFARGRRHDFRNRRPGRQVHLPAQWRAHRLCDEQRLLGGHRLFSRGERPERSWDKVSDIADIALAAQSPVKFKTTCAAFINSDIRIAQQQGQGRDNILAGLVYAIAENYLTKVKGQRPVGKKVLLQGGVALNRAVGYAFAHRVGRPIVIPANPELLGAFGVGLLALERSGRRSGHGHRSADSRVSRDETGWPIHMSGVQDVLQH